jgi:hypothetical protein
MNIEINNSPLNFSGPFPPVTNIVYCAIIVLYLPSGFVRSYVFVSKIVFAPFNERFEITMKWGRSNIFLATLVKWQILS